MTAEPCYAKTYVLSETQLVELLTQAFRAGYNAPRGSASRGQLYDFTAEWLSQARVWSDVVQDGPHCMVCGEVHGVRCPTLEHREMARYS